MTVASGVAAAPTRGLEETQADVDMEDGQGSVLSQTRGSKRSAASASVSCEPAPDFLGKIEEMFARQEKAIASVIETKFTAIDATLQTHSVSLQEQRNEIDLLKKEVAQIKEGGSTKMGTSSNSGGTQWQPKAIWVKGVSSFEERRTEGVTRAEATVFLETLCNHLPPDLRKEIGTLSLDGSKSSRLKVHIKTPDLTLEVLGCLRSIIQEKGITWKDREIWVSRELSATEQRRYALCGKLKSWAEAQGLRKVRASWAPDFLVEASCAAREEAVFAFAVAEDDGPVTWDEGGLEHLLSMGCSEARQSFAMHRR